MMEMRNRDAGQLEFMEIDLREEGEIPRVPIPDRSALRQTGAYPARSGGGILFSEKKFVEEAKRLVDMNVAAAERVPFMSYWPTYGVMDDAQRQWYFFWRSEVRQGRYPDTDLSYVFVHVYELINGIGWQRPEAGYGQLKELWSQYQARLPQLDAYMQDWLVDYALIHRLDGSFGELVDLADGRLPAEVLDMEMCRLLKQAEPHIPLKLLQRYVEYDITLSKFYRDGGREALAEFVPGTIAVVNAYMTRTRGGGIWELYGPSGEKTTERVLFRKAVYDDGLYGKKALLTYSPIGEQPEFVRLATQLFRSIENKLRELSGFRGRLRGNSLEPELAKLVERYLDKAYSARQEKPGERTIIAIDADKLAVLQEESEYVRQALTVEETGDPALLEGDFGTFAEDQPDLPAETTAGSAAGLHPAAEVFEAEDIPGMHTFETQPTTASGLAGAETLWDETTLRELDEEWKQFAAALAPRHVLAILALLGEQPDAALMQVAEQCGTMPALLLDEINDVAMETIGDLLVDGDRIMDEYMDPFEHVKSMR